jgi:hypothetical protein
LAFKKRQQQKGSKLGKYYEHQAFEEGGSGREKVEDAM